MEHVTFVEGRGNLMIEYTSEGASGKAVTASDLNIIELCVGHLSNVHLNVGNNECK